MAAEAVLQYLFRLEPGKSDNRRLSAVGFDVSLPRTVAAFASRVFGRLLAGGDALEVWVLKKLRPDVGVAGLTSLAAYEAARGGTALRQGRWLLCQGRQCGGQDQE